MSVKHQSLRNYLRARSSGERGWVAEYDRAVSANFAEDGRPNYAYLSGHYGALIEDLIEVVGQERLERLLDVLDEIEDGRCREFEKHKE